MKYCEGYKYQLHEDCTLQTPITGFNVARLYFELDASGKLTVKAGYAWDGASGLTIDTKSCMQGALGHDALYQMMREGLLPHDPCFRLANEFLRDQCIKDGMWKWRANIWFKAVERFGNAHAAIQPERVLTAP